MLLKDFLILLNTPTRNASADRALQKTHEALEVALEQSVNPSVRGQADELKRLLRITLNLSRAKGLYDGLCEGRRLQSFESRIKDDPAQFYLTNRIRRFPQATGKGKDIELCRYLDSQITRLRKLKTIHESEMPHPLASWGANGWGNALRNRPSAVSKYISEARKTVLSDDYTFLLAWKRIGESVPRSPSKSVDHRNLHLDKIDWDRGKRARNSPPVAKQKRQAAQKGLSATASGKP